MQISNEMGAGFALCTDEHETRSVTLKEVTMSPHVRPILDGARVQQFWEGTC